MAVKVWAARFEISLSGFLVVCVGPEREEAAVERFPVRRSSPRFFIAPLLGIN